jgi:DNA polymerase III delta prime subunit
MSEQILTIDLNEEYRIKIENPTQFSSSFFKDVYERAAKATADIIEQTNEIKKKEGEFLKEKQEYNNIIAFTGDRGTGKTSAMISFAQYLIKHNGVGFETEDLRINNLKQNKFISIPTIDPSLFENDENIMEVMLAQMFSQFEEKIKEKDTSIDLDKKRKILELFEKVYENLQTIKNGTKKYDGEAIETLSKLACSTKLRENIKKLVLEYITLLCNNTSDSNKSDSNFLIVPIDDFDLNVKGAVEMSEQIRKYFMIPNVIILMSVNMTQLKDAKELSIRKEFKEVLSTMEEDPSKMAIQYLLKLIPDNRRIYMPNIDVNINSLKISIKDKERNIKIYKSIDSCVLGEIYRKTGLIFLSDAYKSHILISYNLRKLIELIVLVYGKMINTDNNNYKSINYNLFDNFFINNIINDYSDIKTKELFFKIKNTRPEKRNYYAIQFLISELKTIHIKHNPEDFKIKNNAYFLTPRHQDSNASYIPRNSHDQEFCDLIDKLNHYSNISLGDLFFILEYYGDFVNNKHSLWLLKSLEVLYSLEIYKYLFIIKKT